MRRAVTDSGEHRLWAAVLCQAFEDLREEEFGSYWYNQAAAFFFSQGDEWADSRRDICDHLGLEPLDIRRPALRIVNRRRLDHGFPPLQARPATSRPPAQRVSPPVAAAVSKPPLPRLVATPAPEPPERKRGGSRTWRDRYPCNPFNPWQELPSERRAAAQPDSEAA